MTVTATVTLHSTVRWFTLRYCCYVLQYYQTANSTLRGEERRRVCVSALPIAEFAGGIDSLPKNSFVLFDGASLLPCLRSPYESESIAGGARTHAQRSLRRCSPLSSSPHPPAPPPLTPPRSPSSHDDRLSSPPHRAVYGSQFSSALCKLAVASLRPEARPAIPFFLAAMPVTRLIHVRVRVRTTRTYT